MRMTFSSHTHLHPPAAIKKRCHLSRIKLKGKLATKEMRRRAVELKGEMEEISEEQMVIKEEQRQVGEKLEAIEEECQKLRKETNVIIQRSAQTQLRLALMFQILKARQQNDFTKAAHLTLLLRGMISTSAVKH
ncbi:NAD(P)-binding Rossmann-fold superfamily protein [Hibiscus syriacus]|uniref:NAD(P)-binding Rossmann-fold superfamily protein n=1 Tax=Hibiscus syriacus TaxID=106335 RepID=A0A6A3C3I6_HIBSY|nr:uncharacterized protein LOC120205205 [Hibiscus syriacus]KAE8723446.1 NAD(P)-binding Rossmann-fold superfamily protein [Hibiscus syriacus]